MHLSCPGREQNPRSLNPHTGSVRALTTSAGSITDRYAYDAFGSALATTGSTTNAYRFTGEQQDAALGMYYLRARYYQPGSGRFWTRDSWPLDVQNPREWNRYVYVAADPVNGVDPRGYATVIGRLCPNECCASLSGGSRSLAVGHTCSSRLCHCTCDF